jgi:hypothetical protein
VSGVVARFKAGDKVILGDHFIDGTNRDWNERGMRQHVGKRATLIRINAFNSRYGNPWYVDVDGGVHYWYETNMKPAIEYLDQKCNECGTSAPHGEPKDGIYTCDFCRAMKDL